MDLLSQIVARAKSNKQRIVLPEAEEERTLCAADKALADELADIILIGNPAKVEALAKEKGLTNIGKATLIDPENYDKSEELAEKLAEIRKSKGMTIEEARKLIKNPLYLGCMIIKTEGADGQISGALSTTGDTLRIADVAVTPMPDANQLAQIAVCTAQMAKAVAGFEDPRVAMLSFSTKGSAKHEVCDKVIEATKLAKEMAPELKIDGELQADAALVPSVGAKKAPGSDIAGKANVLVFPNLEVGNIGYKMVQRLGDAIAIGPVLQGIARPVNDLSRGCSVDDIYYSVMTSGGAERVGLDGAFVKVKLANGEKKQIMHDIPEHTEGVKFIFSLLTDPEIGVIKSLDEIDAVGHRMVHGGEKFNKSVVLTDEVLKAFEECSDLAPLHNPANLKGVNAVKELMPGLPQVGVFDTAFHQTMPAKAYMYAIPYELYEKYGVRRYGFHGTSHRYVSARALEFLGMKAEGTKIITCHIGNGGSIAAVKDGKCIDTSMGLTPLEGLVMGTRSGDIDGGAVTFLEKKLGLDADGMSNLLNKKSGVAGITGGSSDMRDVENAAKAGEPRAVLAQDMYFYRIKKYIGAYAAAMGGVDVIVFTAGVGENQIGMRSEVCKGLEFLGVKFDDQKNNVRGEEVVISADDSKVKVVVIPTDEELMIATDTMNLL